MTSSPWFFFSLTPFCSRPWYSQLLNGNWAALPQAETTSYHIVRRSGVSSQFLALSGSVATEILPGSQASHARSPVGVAPLTGQTLIAAITPILPVQSSPVWIPSLPPVQPHCKGQPTSPPANLPTRHAHTYRVHHVSHWLDSDKRYQSVGIGCQLGPLSFPGIYLRM